MGSQGSRSMSRFRTFTIEYLGQNDPYRVSLGFPEWQWQVDGAVVALSRADAAHKLGLKLGNLGARRRIRVAKQGALSAPRGWSSV